METPENAVPQQTPGRLPGMAAATRLVAFVALVGAASVVLALGWATWSSGRIATSACHMAEDAARESLTHSLEALVEAGRLADARKLVVQAGFWSGMERCTLELPDGTVFADSAEPDAPFVDLPEALGSIDPARLENATELTIADRGSMLLTIRNSPPANLGPGMTDLGVLLAIGAAFCVGLVLMHKRISQSVRPLDAIRSALGAMGAGENESEALTIAPTWGHYASMWNSVIAEREAAKTRSTDAELAQAAAAESPLGGALEKTLDAMPHGVVVFDGSLRIQYANGAAGILLQRRRAELPGESLDSACASDDVMAAAHEVGVEASRRRATVEIERPGPNEGDEPTVLRFGISRIGHGREGLCMVLIEDLTQQRVADRARDTFVAHATHELRTPLTNIRLYMDTLQEEGEEDPALRGRCLNVINQEARRLERMVGDMLSVAEVEAGSLKLHEGDVRLDQLMDDLKGDYDAQAKERSIDLVFDLPPKLPVVRGDRDKIAMSLHNLIGNALKYTPDGGGVTVSMDADDGVAIRVTDTGIGIAPEEVDRIFERFYRSNDKRVAKITGTGLGLSLAREVIRLHGGDIRLESQLDKGSTFTLTLPNTARAA